MEDTLNFIQEKWGSIPNYLKEIGFTIQEQHNLRTVLVKNLDVLHRSATTTPV